MSRMSLLLLPPLFNFSIGRWTRPGRRYARSNYTDRQPTSIHMFSAMCILSNLLRLLRTWLFHVPGVRQSPKESSSWITSPMKFARIYAYWSEQTDTEYIHIDQLCIDQGIPDERNHQMRLMSRMYAGCSYVIVWLDLTATDAAKRFAAPSVLFAAEHDLLNPYFTRLWIVQEVLLFSEIRVFCRNTGMSWTTFSDLIWMKPDWYLSIHKADDKASMAWLFSSSWNDMWDRWSCLPLDRYIDLFACMECEDPRDKIYGLPGLASDEEHPEIDHQKTVPEVFLDAVIALRNTH